MKHHNVKRLKCLLMLFVCSLLLIANVRAQTEISGTVTDNTSEPLPDVTVV